MIVLLHVNLSLSRDYTTRGISSFHHQQYRINNNVSKATNAGTREDEDLEPELAETMKNSHGMVLVSPLALPT